MLGIKGLVKAQISNAIAEPSKLEVSKKRKRERVGGSNVAGNTRKKTVKQSKHK
jgi:hypothetical protein